jgi:hypothetical protein
VLTEGDVCPHGSCEHGGVSDKLVLVLSTPSIPEGEIARSLLEEEGIPALLKGGGVDPYQVGPAHLFVPTEYEVQARLVLESWQAAADEDPSGPKGALEEPEGR